MATRNRNTSAGCEVNGEDHAPVPGDHNPIVKTKGVCGGKARIAGTRIPVWSIENARRSGCSVAAIVKMYSGLTNELVEAALSYASDHPREINRAIRANEDA
jgi:type III restriction enzyme